MKINGLAIGTSLFCFAVIGVQPRQDINMTGYAVSLAVLGILGIISMHMAFREEDE